MRKKHKTSEEAAVEFRATLLSLTEKMAQKRAAAFVVSAVEAEREACARLVLDLDCNFGNDFISANEAAEAIRARAKK